MRINSWNVPSAESARSERSGHAGKASRSERPSAPDRGSDETRLSFSASRIEALEAEIGTMPDIRRERVMELRHAIADGRYQVSSEQVATAITNTMRTRTSSRR